jgi:pimeloyl-ACP methyl ester carboxylesterase
MRGRHPAVVLLFAGYARDHRRMWRYAGFMHQLGLHVLTVDFRSARATSRKPTTLGFWELRDARAALDWAREQPELANARVALFGESLGGAAALALAAQRPDVAAVVADCPFASADAAIADGFACVLHLPAWPLGPIAAPDGPTRHRPRPGCPRCHRGAARPERPAGAADPDHARGSLPARAGGAVERVAGTLWRALDAGRRQAHRGLAPPTARSTSGA